MSKNINQQNKNNSKQIPINNTKIQSEPKSESKIKPKKTNKINNRPNQLKNKLKNKTVSFSSKHLNLNSINATSNTNNKIKQKTKNNTYKSSNNMEKLNSMRNVYNNHPYKYDFDIEYEKLDNLCYNKKNIRKKVEIKNFMKKNREYKEKKIEKENMKLKIFSKIYNNFRNLEKKIKTKNISNKIKKEKKLKNGEGNSIVNENEKSNGSIGDDLEKKYLVGCLEVKWILSKKFDDNVNINNINVIDKNNEAKK